MRTGINSIDNLNDFKKAITALSLQNADPLKDLRKSVIALALNNPSNGLSESLMALAINNPLNDLCESVMASQLSNSLNDLRESVKAIQLIDPFKEVRESIKSLQLAVPIKDIISNIQDLKKPFNLYKELFQNSIPNNSFEEIYTSIFSKVIAAKSDGDISEALSETVNEIAIDSQKIPKSRLSIEFYINIIVCLLMFVYSAHLSHESEKRIINEINNIKKNITEKTEVIDQRPDEVYYVVERAVKLRSKPIIKKDNIIKIFYPNQVTRLVNSKGKRIKVEYFNHITGVHESGWCYKKYLKKIKMFPNQ